MLSIGLVLTISGSRSTFVKVSNDITYWLFFYIPSNFSKFPVTLSISFAPTAWYCSKTRKVTTNIKHHKTNPLWMSLLKMAQSKYKVHMAHMVQTSSKSQLVFHGRYLQRLCHEIGRGHLVFESWVLRI